MIKTKLYKYIGINGTLMTPILLQGSTPLIFYELRAEDGKKLSNGKQEVYAVTVPEDQVENWVEVSGV